MSCANEQQQRINNLTASFKQIIETIKSVADSLRPIKKDFFDDLEKYGNNGAFFKVIIVRNWDPFPDKTVDAHTMLDDMNISDTDTIEICKIKCYQSKYYDMHPSHKFLFDSTLRDWEERDFSVGALFNEDFDQMINIIIEQMPDPFMRAFQKECIQMLVSLGNKEDNIDVYVTNLYAFAEQLEGDYSILYNWIEDFTKRHMDLIT
jgi:hypothetical protein